LSTIGGAQQSQNFQGPFLLFFVQKNKTVFRILGVILIIYSQVLFFQKTHGDTL